MPWARNPAVAIFPELVIEIGLKGKNVLVRMELALRPADAKSPELVSRMDAPKPNVAIPPQVPKETQPKCLSSETGKVEMMITACADAGVGAPAINIVTRAVPAKRKRRLGSQGRGSAIGAQGWRCAVIFTLTPRSRRRPIIKSPA